MKYQLFLGKVLSPKKFTTFGRQNNICAARNMVANESARMAFDYLKPSNIFSKKSMIQTTGNCSFFRCHHNFKNSKTYGNLFSKKQSAQLPYNEASHHRVNISRLGNWVSSVFCHFNRRFLKSKSEAHESFMASKRFLSSSARSAVR